MTTTTEHRRIAEAAYEALRATERLSQHRLLTYRCAERGCLLLDVVQLPEPVGRLFYQPAYKLSPVRNEESSSPEGRARNTVDGDRRWKPRTQTEAALINYTVTCDHLAGIALPAERVARDLQARGKTVMVTAEDHEPAHTM